MSRSIRALRAISIRRACMMAASLVLACSGSDLLSPSDEPITPDGSSPVPFPDSVVASRGLPPMANTASTRVLAPDTLVQTTISATPVYAAGQSMQVALRVLVRDTSTSTLRARTLSLSACPFVLRLYRNENAATTTVWQSDRASGVLRCPVPQELGNGGTDVMMTWDVPAMLGDSLPSGRYAFGYTLRTADGRVLEFTNGSGYLTTDPTPATDDLSTIKWTAQSKVESAGPRMLRTTVTLKNTGSRSVALNYGACNVNVRLFRTADRSGEPAWRSELRKPPGNSFTYVCILPLYIRFLAPGDSLQFPVAYPMYEVVADSLPAARYYVTALASVAGGDGYNTSRGPSVGQSLAAGAVDLTRDPDRLPGSRVIDSLSYTATTRLVRGANGADTIRTLVMVTNTSTVRREADVARECAVVVYAYRSAALRDSVPAQVPSAYPNPACSLSLLHYVLEPGQSWVFGRDVPMATARAALAAGRYWFAAWLTGSSATLLAAGNAEVR